MRCFLALTIVALLSIPYAVATAEDEKPEFTIKQVMEKAHKNKLMNKLAEGKGTKEEAQELLKMYKALGGNKPPKGDVEGWKKKTVELIDAAQAVVDGKEGAGTRLQKAANCAACHKEHKPQ